VDITEFYTKISETINGLTPEEINLIFKILKEKGYCDDLQINKNDQNAIKDAIKERVQKISIEDLELITPEPIKKIIQEYKDQDLNEIYSDDDEDSQEIINSVSNKEETKEQLIQEALAISSNRGNDREEIPKDMRTRLSYIASKLNIKYKLSKRQITKLINLNHITVGKYITECVNAQPDLIRIWSGSAEAKSIQKIEDTMAKTSADRTITNLKDSISIADNIREKYAIIAAQRGYNLYSSGDLEKLVNSAVQLYFSNDSVYINIIALETENERLRQQVNIFRGQIEEYDELNCYFLINSRG